ncbi:MAG: hypothetical protein HUJ66_05445 [Oscillospiraceae bacterium]|nr:hypothetical protein [Oscillospiraceae bacterium]
MKKPNLPVQSFIVENTDNIAVRGNRKTARAIFAQIVRAVFVANAVFSCLNFVKVNQLTVLQISSCNLKAISKSLGVSIFVHLESVISPGKSYPPIAIRA